MLIDTNVLIAAATRAHDHHEAALEFIERADGPLFVSALTRVEFLGWPGSPGELALRDLIYEQHRELPVDGAVIDLAALLRRRRKSLQTADAVIAATAFRYRLSLVTANVRDFAWIDGLEVLDPTA